MVQVMNEWIRYVFIVWSSQFLVNKMIYDNYSALHNAIYCLIAENYLLYKGCGLVDIRCLAESFEQNIDENVRAVTMKVSKTVTQSTQYFITMKEVWSTWTTVINNLLFITKLHYERYDIWIVFVLIKNRYKRKLSLTTNLNFIMMIIHLLNTYWVWRRICN